MTQPKPFELIDTIAKPITFVGSSLIFFSILKSYIFYATFGIKITNYISFSEAILLFVNEIAVLVLYFVLLFALLGLILSICKLKLLDLLLPNTNANLFHKLFCLALYTYPLFYLLYALVLNVRSYGNPTMFYFLLVCAIVIEILIIVYMIKWWKKLNRDRANSGRKVLQYTFFISILFFYTWSLERQLFLFHRNKINKTVVAYQSGSPIHITNKQIQFLGSTGKYLFCYNKTQEVAIVIDAAGFDKIEFGKYTHLPGFSIFDLLFH